MTAVLNFPAVGNWSWFASNAVACPKCKSRSGSPCYSTGGGNTAVVSTHKVRRDRVAGWPKEFANRAGWAARRHQRRHGEAWPDDAFAEFEAAAAPIVDKPVKQPTPKGVRLSEAQAEEIEGYVLRGGYGSVSTAHFHGDAQHRQTVNALEAKRIVEFVELDESGYSRWMKLTEFGWAVYREHRLIIRRLTDAQVAVQVARAEAARTCAVCNGPSGQTAECVRCGIDEDVRLERLGDV